jgi:ribosome biogenesis GTPase
MIQMNTTMGKIKLEDLGYDEFFEGGVKADPDKIFTPARIVAEYKESYVLKGEISEFSAKVTGKMMFTSSTREDYPAVGDWVLVSFPDKGKTIIHEILPRKSVLKRKSITKPDAQIIASNIDFAFIVQSPDRDYSLNRMERYFSIAEAGNIKPAIIMNKTDLISREHLEQKWNEMSRRFPDAAIFTTSIITGNGMDDLNDFIKKGLTYCFIGSSGVGKSSLINILIGKDIIKTGEISFRTNRGKHITTHRQLFLLKDGGLVIDNPGMREIGLIDARKGIEIVFEDISDIAKNCQFSDCSHIHEPGCAVLAAVKEGDLDGKKYSNFVKLIRENEYHSLSKLEMREKDRRFGRMVKQFKKHKKSQERSR